MADEEKKDEKAAEAKEAETGEAAKEEASTDEVKEEKAETPKEEPKAEEANAANEADETPVEVPDKFKKLIEEIETMSVLDLHELVKTLEKKFGVSAAAVAAAPAAGADAGGGEEQSEFTVALTSAGDQKIQVIKAVKEVLGLGLKEAKDLVDGAPADLKAGVKKEEAEEIKTKIEEAGGSVELK